MKIRMIGSGGQGTVLASIILGRAAAIHDNKYAVQTQASMSASVRGGLVKTDVIIDDKPIIDVTFDEPDIFLLLSKTGKQIEYKKCRLIVDSSMDVQGAEKKPFISTAFKLGDSRTANMVMLGFLSKLGVVSTDALKKCVDETMAEKIREINKKAIDEGTRL